MQSIKDMRTVIKIIFFAALSVVWTIACSFIAVFSIFLIYGTGDGGIGELYRYLPDYTIPIIGILTFALWLYGLYKILCWIVRDVENLDNDIS